MAIPVGQEIGTKRVVAVGWRSALWVAGVGMIAVAPLGCTLSMTLRKEPSGDKAPAVAKVEKETGAEKSEAVVPVKTSTAGRSQAAKPRAGNPAVAKSEETKPQSAKSQAAGPHYLPDSLIDDSTPEPIQRPTSAGKIVNVFGEFTGSGHGAKLAMDPALQQVTFPEAGYDTEPAVSPTSKAVVFSSTRGGEHAQLYLQKAGSAAVTQLTDSAGDSAQPSFNADGSRIAFCSNRTGNWHLYLMDTDGRHVTRVTEGPTQDMHPSFSPDGGKLVYCTLSAASDQWQIGTIDIATGVKKTLGRGLFPAWSPDRTRSRIVFQKTRAKGSRWFSLWTMEIVEDEPVNLCEIAVSANAALVGPSWSSDGKKLAFSAIVEPGETRNGKPKGEQDVWVCDADGSDRQRLTDGTGANIGPCWAVDSRVYFVSDRSGQECIWSLPARVCASNEQNIAASELQNGKRGVEAGKLLHAPAAAADPSELNK